MKAEKLAWALSKASAWRGTWTTPPRDLGKIRSLGADGVNKVAWRHGGGRHGGARKDLAAAHAAPASYHMFCAFDAGLESIEAQRCSYEVRR